MAESDNLKLERTNEKQRWSRIIKQRKVAFVLSIMSRRKKINRRLKWTDVDLVHGIVTFNLPEKDGKPRQFKVSQKLVAMLNSLPKASQRVWEWTIQTQ